MFQVAGALAEVAVLFFLTLVFDVTLGTAVVAEYDLSVGTFVALPLMRPLWPGPRTL